MTGAPEPHEGPSHRFSGHEPSAGHDTAGVPWTGRTLTGTGFDGDRGEADERLSALLAQDRPDPAAVVAAVAAARLITAIVAVPGEIDDSSGIPVDATSDMASVTLVAPDGQRAMPTFTSTAALAAWNAEARPVPVTAQRAAVAAVQEGCDIMLLDLPAPPGSPAFTLRSSMVWALAMAQPWVPAHEDDHVARAVAHAVAEEAAVADHALAAGTDGALLVDLALRPGLDQQQVHDLLTRVGERLATDGEARARIDALAFSVRTA